MSNVQGVGKSVGEAMCPGWQGLPETPDAWLLAPHLLCDLGQGASSF